MNNLKKALMWLTVLLNLWAIPLKSFSQNVWCDKQDSLILDEMYRKSPTIKDLGWHDKPVANWMGVTLNSSGRVSSINLGDSKILFFEALFIPENFGDLSELTVLYLKTLNGLPATCTKLQKLETLNVSSSTYISNIVFDISNISELKKLKNISLNGGWYGGTISVLPNKENIESIEIKSVKDNITTNLSLFNNCPNLTKLILYNVNLTNSPCTVNNLPRLKQLEITYCNLAGEIQPMIGTDSLTVLSFSNNQLTGPIASRLSKRIENLNLMKNKFTNELESNFGELLPNLKWVNLSYNNLSGNIPLSVAKLKNMTSLNVQNNKFLLKHVDFIDSLIQKYGITFTYENQDSLYKAEMTFEGDSTVISIDVKEPLTNEMDFSWIFENKVIKTTQKPEIKIYSSDYYPNGWYCMLAKRKNVGSKQYTINQPTSSFTPSKGIKEIVDSVTWQGNVVISGSTKITGAVNILQGTTITFESNSLLSFESGSRLYINTQKGDSIRFNYKKTSDTIRQPNLAYIYFNANSALKTSFNKCAFRGFDKSIVSVSANGVIANSTALFDNCSFNDINGLAQIGRLQIQNGNNVVLDYPVISNSTFNNCSNLIPYTTLPVIFNHNRFSNMGAVFNGLFEVWTSDCTFENMNGPVFTSISKLKSTGNIFRKNNSNIFSGTYSTFLSDRDSFLYNNVSEFNCSANDYFSSAIQTISNGYFTKDTLQKIQNYTLGSFSSTQNIIRFSGNFLDKVPLIGVKPDSPNKNLVYYFSIHGPKVEILNNKIYKAFTPNGYYADLFYTTGNVNIVKGNELIGSNLFLFVLNAKIFDGNRIIGNSFNGKMFGTIPVQSFSNNLILNNEFTKPLDYHSVCDTIANNTIINTVFNGQPSNSVIANNIGVIENTYNNTVKSEMYNNVNGYTGPDSYLLDPLFVKPVSFTGIPKNAAEEAELLASDYHLKPNSPLIDAGKTISKSDMLASLRDAEGNPRIQGNAIDIGCYEAPKANGSAKSVKPTIVQLSPGFVLFPITNLPNAMLLDAGSDIYITKEREAMLSPLFVKGGISPYTFKYMGESETLHGPNPTVKAEDKTYILVVTDSCGCTATDTIRIFLSGTGVEPAQAETSALELNIAGITNSGIRFRIENSGSAQKAGEFAVYSIDGKLLCRIPVEPFNASAEVFVSAEYTQRVFVVQYRNNNTMVSRKVVFGK